MKDLFIGVVGVIGGLLVSLVAVRALLRYAKSQQSKVVDNPSAEVAIECLTDLGYKRPEAEHRVALALEQAPDGDENKLVNIAIRL